MTASTTDSFFGRRDFLRGLTGLGILGTGLPEANAGIGRIVRHAGRTYVTANQIRSYYKFSGMSAKGAAIYFTSAKMKLRARVGSQELYINGVKFILSFPVARKGSDYLFSTTDISKLIHPVLRPNFIRTATPFTTVVIDPGHGGGAPGSRNSRGGLEKTYTLKLAYRLKREVERRGLKVRLTRTKDTSLSLSRRVALANAVPNSIFVSLHFNWASRSSARGVETFALSPQGTESTFTGARSSDDNWFKGNSRDGENIALATAVHAYSLRILKPVDRGVKRARYAVLRGLNRPGVLYEGGFMSNRAESGKIATGSYLDKMARGIAQGIAAYRKELH